MNPPGGVGRLYGVWDDTWSLTRRATFIIDRAGRVRFVDAGGLAIDTGRTIAALQQLARTK